MNKLKLLAITSGLLATSGVFAEFSLPALDVDAKIEFDSAYISEGRRLGDLTFVPSAELGLPLFGDAGRLYTGVDAYLAVNSAKALGNNVAPYVGFSYDLTDRFTADFGYTYSRLGSGKDKLRINHVGGKGFALLNAAGDKFIGDADGADLADKSNAEWGTARKYLSTKRATHELYAGVIGDFLLNPTLYFAYDFTQRKANVETEISHTFDLGAQGINGFAIDLGARLGYSRVKKPYGIDRKTQVVFETLDNDGEHLDVADHNSNLFEKKGWFYAGVNADLVYSLNENTKARAGVEFAFNNAKKDTWINEFNQKRQNVWFSTAFEFTF
ncbi:MAG: hypothetical protein LBN94_01095 [Puniceicoccales bacterium]|jgi:opacity protein-like surface antigen|nr:hypothetical protein [Puniceicoccales bacterium]